MGNSNNNNDNNNNNNDNNNNNYYYTILKISNDQMEDIIRIVKSLEDSGLLLKGVSKQFKMKLKNKKEDFLVCY